MNKIQLYLKYKIGRKKVIKRYNNIMKNFPILPKYDGNYEKYVDKIYKYTLLLARMNRLFNIYRNYYKIFY